MIEQTQMINLLSRIEARIHRDGWNQPHMLGYVETYGRTGGPDFTMMQTELPDPLEAFMGFMAARFEAHTPMLARQMTGDPEFFLGFVLIHESWAVSSPSQLQEKTHSDYLELTQNRGMSLEHVPGSTDVRQVYLVDVHGREFGIMRLNGHQPLANLGHEPHFRITECSMYSALARMTRAVAALMPASMTDLAALDTLISAMDVPADNLS